MREFTKEECLWLWLNSVTGHHVKLFHRIYAQFDSMEELYRLAGKGGLPALEGVDDKVIEKLKASANERYIAQYVSWLRKREIDVAIATDESRYPALLNEIQSPPTVLFIKGRLDPEPELPIAMVGMRNNSIYGERMARRLGMELCQCGATIVSGMADGIDRFSALGALSVVDSANPTVAVLGCGVDVIYPSGNDALYHSIVERGAVVSEFLPKTRPHKGNFPIRNRIISGLSLGTVIVEGGSRSGASITANYALEQNRDVFAVPGEIDRETSACPNRLIRQNWAKPVFHVNDILEEYDRHMVTPEEGAALDQSRWPEVNRRIYEALKRGPMSADELCEMLSLPAAQVNSALTSMEFSGIMKQLPGRVYSI